LPNFVRKFRRYTRLMLRGVDQGAEAVGVLEDELRRQLYRIVRRAGQALSRDDVAGQAGISRRLAAFHLDKLNARGLLRAHYARPPGRSGPGAGRSAKYYEPSDLEVDVSIPQRRYDLAGRLLIRAITSASSHEPASAAAARVAKEAGAEVGDRVRQEKRLRHPGAERALTTAAHVLDEYGFEPYWPERDRVAFRNCPFRELAQEAPQVMCWMNQAFVEGLLRGIGNHTIQAVRESTPGDCCVTLRRA
jgi:predicted ArsR family transcriptional regulator